MSPTPLLLVALLQANAAGVIRVGGISLTAEEITARANDYVREQSGRTPSPDAFVNALLDEMLLASDAESSGLLSSPDGRAAIEAERARVLAREYWEREFLAKAKPPEAMVRDLFHETQDTVRLRLVVLSTRQEAEAARARLQAGGDFALEAARSLHPSSSAKGDTGVVGRRTLDPALATAAFESPKGSLFGPIELALGFAVAEVVERNVADEKRLAAERPTLEAWARRQLAGKARGHFLEMSQKKQGVVLDEQFLESLGKSTTATDAQAEHVIAKIGDRSVRFREIVPEIQQWAGAGGSHMFGPTVRIRVAKAHLDNLLLAAAAADAGIAKLPGVSATIRVAELAALARLRAVRLASSAPASAPQDRDRLVSDRLQTLRRKIPISIDRPTAVAATQRAFAVAQTAR